MENVLLTSWGWLLLCDFAPYKPIYIDMTKTVDFTYYFDTSGRRMCCLAPERFQVCYVCNARCVTMSHLDASMQALTGSVCPQCLSKCNPAGFHNLLACHMPEVWH
jgi:hypothetical protein